MKRRAFLQSSLASGGLALGAGLGLTNLANSQNLGSDYKAVVVVFLSGGNDGNNVLVPTDGAFSDYQKARPSIAMGKADLVNFAKPQLGHAMGLHSAMAPLMPLFNQERLAFLINAGALVQPTTVSQVLNGQAVLPPFLYSHPEQTHTIMGWQGDEDQSGWGGRGLEAMSGFKNLKAPLVSIDNSGETLVTGQKSRYVAANSGYSRQIGSANLLDKTNIWTQTIESITRMQSDHLLQAEYARTFRSIFTDATELANVENVAPVPAGNFVDDDIGRKLKFVARTSNYYRMIGASRQIYSVQWGSFDTHTSQRGLTSSTGVQTQDAQLASLANALKAFDDSIQAAGMDKNVTVLVTSEFGRTLDPAAGLGSDHAWGNHWWVMGGAVKGGQMLGAKFPGMQLRGADDGDPGGRGYWVPQIASDQVAAELLSWLGLSASQVLKVLPNIARFPSSKVGFMA